MNKLSKEKRDKLILTILTIVGVLGVLYTFVLGVQKDQLYTLQAKILSTRDKVSKAERLVKAAPMIEASLAESRKLVSERESDMAPTGQSFYWFFKLLETFRQAENLPSIALVEISQPEFTDVGLLPKFPYQSAVFTVRLTGRFAELGKFLADFENKYPYIRVQNVVLQPDTLGAGAQSGSLSESSERLLIYLKVVTLIKPSAT